MRHPDSEPNLEDDDIPDASELLDFELIAKSQPDKGQGLWLWLILLLVLAGGGWAGWMYLNPTVEQEVVSADGLPTIRAPEFPLKEKPSDPGGMKVPDRDKLIYDRMAGEGTQPVEGVERLLPPPESPLEPPTPETAPLAEPAPAPETAATVAESAAPIQSAPAQEPAAPTALQPQPQPEAKAAQPQPVQPPALEPQAPVAPAAPAPETKAPAAPSNSAFAPTGPAGQGFVIQLSAVRTEQDAAAEWARMTKQHADVLGALELSVQRADLGVKGIYYRVRGGWFANRADAKAVCDELTRRNVGCIVAKP